MTRIRKINVSQVEGGTADNTDTGEIRPFGETAFYVDDSGPNDKLTLMMFDGVRTHQKSKVLSPGMLFGSNADSGDGAGLDTIKLIPDATLHNNGGDGNNHQHLVIDPTAPNHIHIRAGGAIDNSNADLFLGGELTHVKVSDGYDNVVIRTSTVGEGVTPHDWTFGDNGYLTFPDGTESSGQGIWPPVDGGLGITLTRNVELSAVAAVNSGEDVLYIDISENDDISVVNVLWQLNTGTLTAPILTPVTNSITPEPGIYSISVSGFTFVPGETYTFRSNSVDIVDWVFMPTGELRTSGLGTISHYPGSTSSLKFEVPSSNDIVLRTAGGDLTYGADGSLTFPDNTVQTTAYTGGGGDATGVSRSDDNLIIRLTDPNDDGLELRSILVNGSDQNVSSTVLGSNGFVISTNSNVSQKQWQFGNAGSITFPDGDVQTTAYAGGQGHMMMIDTNRTDTYTEVGSADKPFKTFAAAIAAATASTDTTFTFVLMGCTVTENVNFNGCGLTAITIATSCRSVISGNITIANNPELSQLVVRNIEVGGTFTLTGNATNEQMNNCSFYNVSFSGAVNITATNATAFYEAAFFSTVAFTNISYLYINGAQFNDDWTITADDTGTYPIPSRGLNTGTGGSISIVFGTIANDINFVKGGTAAYVFQPHMARMGRSGQTYTLPAGWTMTPHSSVLRGTWVNNGTTTMRNSSSDLAITGAARAYTGIIGGDRVVADLVPANSTGAAGDAAGSIAVGGGYLYVCTANWVSPGTANIWTRTALTTGAW